MIKREAFSVNAERLKEIMAKEQDFVARGGKWIVYVPKVGVI